jgi:hypothetical protein
MKDWTVIITYRTGTHSIESVHTITCLSEAFAKAQAKRTLNRTGIFGSFDYKVYGGETAVDKTEQVF